MSRYIKLNQTNYFFFRHQSWIHCPQKKIENRLPGQELANPPSVCVFSVLVGILEFCNRLWDFAFRVFVYPRLWLRLRCAAISAFFHGYFQPSLLCRFVEEALIRCLQLTWFLSHTTLSR
jgi:hypothetical protein